MVIALAGRRIDDPSAETARFPQKNASKVRSRIGKWMVKHEIDTLVCSAACGANLLALDVAGELGICRCIVLPFPREQFRVESVIDRGDEWGGLFDTILDAAEANGDIIVLGYIPENETAYLETNHVILELAVSRGAEVAQPVEAVLVWDGMSRGDDDVTKAFQEEARARGLAVVEISTL